MMDPKKIGRRIRDLRVEKGLTQAEMGEQIGTAPSTVNMYENGERIPRDEIKIMIALLFGKSVQEIFFDE